MLWNNKTLSFYFWQPGRESQRRAPQNSKTLRILSTEKYSLRSQESSGKNPELFERGSSLGYSIESKAIPYHVLQCEVICKTEIYEYHLEIREKIHGR